MLAVLPICAGLIIEWLVLWFGGFGLSWRKAAIVDVVMNAVSSLVGIILIPGLGFAWEVLPGLLLYKLFNTGTFNPGTWAATFVMAVLASTTIEAFVVRWGFSIPLGRRRFLMLSVGNIASVAIAFWSLWIHPPRL